MGRARLLFARPQPARLRGRGTARAWRGVSRTREKEGLRALPGIGPYTAAAIAAIAFDVRTMPVDGNIERVVSRLYAVEEPLPQAKPRDPANWPRRCWLSATRSRAGDSAQALMDLGSSICTPKKPACALCPLNEDCVARARGDQEIFPRKAPKKTGTLRRGAAFIVTRGDELLVRTRAEKGLLGGMTEVPGSDWLAGHGGEGGFATGARAHGHRQMASQGRRGDACLHAFSARARGLHGKSSAAGRARTEGMRWVPVATLADEALPNVMRKAIAHGLGSLTPLHRC